MYKKGQKLNVETRAKGVVPATFVAEHTGTKGSYLEVNHGDGRATKRYRPAKVTAA